MSRSSHDVTKLPKWAQRRIETLERNLASLKAERAGNWTDGGETEVFIRNYQDGNIPLPKGSRIVFELGEEEYDRTIEVGLSARGRKPVVEVYGSGRKGHRLVIEPSLSNVVYVSNEDYPRH